jgi:hypothetical protein
MPGAFLLNPDDSWKIDVVCADVEKFSIREPLILCLYNPFGPPVQGGGCGMQPILCGRQRGGFS